jgi:hypothetical protein
MSLIVFSHSKIKITIKFNEKVNFVAILRILHLQLRLGRNQIFWQR